MTREFINPLINFYFSIIINSALLTKLGAAPFHFWFPEVIEGLNWANSLILLTWQKIAPIILLMNNKINTQFLIVVIISCLIIRTVRGFNQIRLRKILAFSSINHIAWILSTLIISLSIWIIYFIIYCLINLNVIIIFRSTKSFYINQINNIINKNKITKLSFIINFISLGGLPPFIGFLPKWLVINWLTNNQLILITFIIIVTTLIILFIYIRIIISSIVISSAELKNTKIETNTPIFTIINIWTIPRIILCTIILNFL